MHLRQGKEQKITFRGLEIVLKVSANFLAPSTVGTKRIGIWKHASRNSFLNI